MDAKLKKNIYTKITDYYSIINRIDGIVQNSHFQEDEGKIDVLEQISTELHEATDHMLDLYVEYTKNTQDTHSVEEIRNVLQELLEKVASSRDKIKNIYHDILSN